VPIAATTVMPMALFSLKVKSRDQVTPGGMVAIANAPANGAQKAGLITLKSEVGDGTTIEDIAANPKHLRFLQLEAARLRPVLDGVSVAQVSLSYPVMSGGDSTTALLTDGAGNPHYALNFVVQDDPRIVRFVEIYRSPEVKAFMLAHCRTYLAPVL
jgi:D-methionine transport system substrate-binding protein